MPDIKFNIEFKEKTKDFQGFILSGKMTVDGTFKCSFTLTDDDEYSTNDITSFLEQDENVINYKLEEL